MKNKKGLLMLDELVAIMAFSTAALFAASAIMGAQHSMSSGIIQGQAALNRAEELQNIIFLEETGPNTSTSMLSQGNLSQGKTTALYGPKNLSSAGSLQISRMLYINGTVAYIGVKNEIANES
ncbi:MAG: hypothetical protein LVQ97_00440 [Candidatus Micrarchaeales archaeon]|nr:hypothetical protein [Candidatus Micrarchaeales archaeon]